jgi:hypothetical protein
MGNKITIYVRYYMRKAYWVFYHWKSDVEVGVSAVGIEYTRIRTTDDLAELTRLIREKYFDSSPDVEIGISHWTELDGLRNVDLT